MVVVATEQSQHLDRIVSNIGLLSNNDDLLKIWSKVIGPEVIEVTAQTATQKWNTDNDVDQNLKNGNDLLKKAVDFGDALEFGCDTFQVSEWNHANATNQEDYVANDDEYWVL